VTTPPVKDRANLDSEGTPGHSGRTPSSLLTGVRAGDAAAWRRLARLYGPFVYGRCRRLGLQAADAEDVTQEVFRTVAARVADFRHGRDADTFRGWLAAILRHKLGDWIRRQQATAVAAGDRLATVADPVPADPEAEAGELAALCRRALALIEGEFAPATWRAFWATAVDGRSPGDVAAELGLTRNATYVAKSRVLSRLRDVLGDQ
jgi:RNA polymerase sigma-70 factor (ECF subfamily)